MGRLLAAAAFVLSLSACADPASPGGAQLDVSEPDMDASGPVFDANPLSDRATLEDAPADDADNTPPANVETTACGCRIGPEPSEPSLVLGALIVLIFVLRRSRTLVLV